MLHSISAKRASSRTILRLTQQEWCQEVDICCVLGWLNLVPEFHNVFLFLKLFSHQRASIPNASQVVSMNLLHQFGNDTANARGDDKSAVR